MTGQTLSHFEVLEKLGEGGMGVVYKGRDTQLNRLVALKVLPAGKLADSERRRRFIQEARSASALNHPNIVTIYEIAQDKGIDFIAMELIPGRTLDRIIPKRGLAIPEALRYAVQIAGALTRAHAAGITHRDLKPANIMVNGEGQVKLLDFGLAKLSEPVTASGELAETISAPADDAPLTEEGSILGTAAYMSPEQAEGLVVDARSDIFSFGAVFYEMLSGQRAFLRETRMATLSAVMREEPRPLLEAVSGGIPRDLEKLIARCMRKSPERRAQHMADVKLAIEELREESESGAHSAKSQAAAHAGSRFGTPWMLPAAGLAVAAILGGGYWIQRNRNADAAPTMKVSNLTSYPGSEVDPALSPDGKEVAFSWNGEKEDNYDIYVKLVDAGTPVRLTQDPNRDSAPAWSPDGRYLAFARRSGKEFEGAYYVIPALGGAERKVAEFHDYPSHFPSPSVSWAPDGKSILIVDTSVKPPRIAQVSVESGEKKALTVADPKGWGDASPAVSPDGWWLAFQRVENAGASDWSMVPWGADPATPPTRISNSHSFISGGSWTADSEGVVFSVIGGQMYRVAINGSAAPVPILNLGQETHNPSIARQGGRMAFERSYADINLWKADLLHPDAPPVRAIASTREEFQPDYSPDGSRVAFVSDRSGEREVWIAGDDGSSKPVQLTTQGARPTAPRWSPDGKWIAFAKRPGGNADVYVVDAQGGSPRRLTTNPGNDASAFWSRDGRWIYFASNRTGRNEVWKIAADGSSPEVQLTRNGGWRSGESPDGKTLYYQRFDLPGTFKMPVEGGEEQKVLDTPGGAMWHVAGNSIYWTRGFSDGDDGLHRFDLETGKDRIALNLPPETSRGNFNFGVTPDGRWLVFVRVDANISDLMLVENFR